MKLYALTLCALVTFTACKKEKKAEYTVNVQVKEITDADVPTAQVTTTKHMAITSGPNTTVSETVETTEMPMPEGAFNGETVLDALALDEEAPDADDDTEEVDIDTADIVT